MPRLRTASLTAAFATALLATSGAATTTAAPIEPVGTVARTTEVLFGDRSVDHAATLGGAVYFVTDAPGGSELWKTDGSDAGSTRVRTLPAPGGTSPTMPPFLPARSGPAEIVATSSRLFFVLQDGLWTSDGTPDGTQRLLENTDSFLTDLALAGERVIVRRSTPVAFGTNAAGARTTYWGSDGTPGGTAQVFDAGVDDPHRGARRIDTGVATYFQRFGLGVFDRRIVRSDGTPAGTAPYGASIETEYGPATASGQLAGAFEGQAMTLLGDRLTIGDGPGARTIAPVSGVVRTAADAGSTVEVYRGPGDLLFMTAGRQPTATVTYGSPRLYRVAPDGVPQLALPTSFADGDDALGEHVRFGNTFAFTVKHGDGLIVTPNDPPGNPGASLACVRPLAPGTGNRDLTVVGRWMYFVSTVGTMGSELWRTDGSWQGTQLVEDLRPGPASSAPGPITRLGNLLLFSATGADGVRRQYRLAVDPTGAGPEAVDGCPSPPEPSGKGFPDPVPDLPGYLTIRAGKSHDLRAPYRWTISGRLLLPTRSSPVFLCQGSVIVTVKRGRRVVAKKKVKAFPMKTTCGYQAQVSVKSRTLARRGTLSVRARYGGHETNLPSSSKSLRLRYGLR